MKRLFAIALLFAGLAARAQETPTVTARVEPDSIMIGDRFDYVIDVEKDLVQVVEFPVFDPRDGKIELVENCPVDTLERDGRRLKLRKRYRLAAFDEGKYNLGAAQVLYADKNILDTLRSTDSVYLEVATFQIDSTSQSIYDLKAQKTLPFRFRDKNNTPPKIATAPISSDSFIVFKSGSPVPKKESNMIVAAADTINPREAAFNPLSVSKI